jgi:carboxypeptidase C (cathepsin A)
VSSRARIFYTVQPADPPAEDKPILVVFNGGPGAASAVLRGWNTGDRTIDPAITGDRSVAANPSRWTRFANVLYVDARGVGFSYDVIDDPSDPVARDADFGTQNYNKFLDAADFVRVTLRVLERHPELHGEAVPVGESYGGTRATLMVHMTRKPRQSRRRRHVHHARAIRCGLSGRRARPDPPRLRRCGGVGRHRRQRR